MPLQAEQQKQKLVESAAALCMKRRRADPEAAGLAAFIRRFYAHVPPDDVLARAPEDLYGAALSLWELARQRQPGAAKVRVFNPLPERDGWRSSRTVVEVANDDMPFLVDSVTMALNGSDCTVHLVIHPIVQVRRGEDGALLELVENGAPKGDGGGRSIRESLMHIEIGQEEDPARLEMLRTKIAAALEDVRHAVADWQPIRSALARALDDLASDPPPLPHKEVAEAAAFLRWLDDGNFTFLGYREYRFGKGGVAVVPASGLGILRDDAYSVFDGLRHVGRLAPELRDFLRAPRLLLIAKSNRRATVHRPARMDAIGVKLFGPDGEVVGERLFLGLFTSLAYSRSTSSIPLLRLKVQQTLARAGFSPTSHDGKALLHILDTFPRDEIFQISREELFDTALGILNLQERQRIALFVRRDPFERFVSCLVYVPRDRYSTELRRKMGAILETALNGTIDGFQTQLDDSPLARVHFVIATRRGALPEADTAEIERRLVEAGRSWTDHLAVALTAERGEEGARATLKRFGEAFPTAYRERMPAAAAVADLERVEAVLAGAPIALSLHRGREGGAGTLGFTIVHPGRPIALSDILPMLENMGLRVIGEVPHAIAPDGKSGAVWLQEFELDTHDGAGIDLERARPCFEDAFARVWADEMENDGFNRLVLLAGLNWRQVVILRAYAKALRQAGGTFSQQYMEDTLAAHPQIAARLTALFERRFDPAREKKREAEADGIVQEIGRLLDGVTNLDEDRILRSFLVLIEKTLRTNYYQRTGAGAPKPYLSFKLASHEIDLLPRPRPLYEIFVYSPRVEGVHLRGGKVARGGIRWSDRKEDFRTEILGLMKAQMVKNAVIVPVGSKGGFVVKRPPPATAGREAMLAEGVACYTTLMRGLLDLTDNIVGDHVVPPAQVVRRDDDDPYLVVAADKGTATFSDIANGVSAEYGFWLGDAFASGGSAGYDHKAMGITARGAWETVKRHFRELGIDIQNTDFTCVGVGDMSGDVFGNGMLRSRHTKLLGAFNHLHIFVDPDPDPEASFGERERLSKLPRSSWIDYDKRLISKGGGVFERTAKSIAVSPEMKQAFGLEGDHVTPPELIQAILKAPVDLLWFGGIGTYVKASDEPNLQVGDRANDALRVNGAELRARVTGEGANLAMTQRARIEYAAKGGRLNTDAIDNSAGVDTSDHEVNIKVLLGGAISAGELDPAERDGLLAEMTEDVAALVLRDNYLQSLAISLAEAKGPAALDRHVRLMKALERGGHLDRALEFLPDDEGLAERAAAHRGLTRPELAVLIAYAKNTLYAELLPSDLPDDRQLVADLVRYFPRTLAKRFRGAMEKHRLRREIIATFVTNSMVNRGGITFVNDMKESTGRSASDIARAYAVTRDAFELRPLWGAIDALDGKTPASLQYEMLLAVGQLVEHATAWFLRSGLPLDDVQARLDDFRPGIAVLTRRLPELLPEEAKVVLATRTRELGERGVSPAAAERVARLDFLFAAPDIVRLGRGSPLDITEAGRVYFAIGSRFSLDRLRRAARRIKADTTWQKMAVDALVDDLFALQIELAAKVIGDGSRPADAALGAWLAAQAAHLGPLDAMLHDLAAAPAVDLAMLTVAARQVRNLAR